jgi:hypothetical protein
LLAEATKNKTTSYAQRNKGFYLLSLPDPGSRERREHNPGH